ncbi:DNA-formamidopyrimidine glycosylase family protein [Actinomycetes bacterium M1A6_2h]
MPEGDTVWRTANSLRDALVARELTVCDVRVPRYATVDLSGSVVDSVDSRGKHLLVRAGGKVIHSHLKMEGAWHVYVPDTKWRRPAYQARIVLANSERTAVGFELGVVEILDDDDSAVGYLGPDLLGADWDASVAAANLEADPARPVGLALLDQRVIAGLGNVYRNEVCFLRGVRPTTPVARVGDIGKLVDVSFRTIHANKNRNGRTMTGDLRPGRQFWVYGRENKPCRRCGAGIVFGHLGDNPLEERQIYYCPRCQR